MSASSELVGGLTAQQKESIKAAVLAKMRSKEFVDVIVQCLCKHGGNFGGDDFYFDLFMAMAAQEHKSSVSSLKAEVSRLGASLTETSDELFDAKQKLAFYEDHKCDDMICRVCKFPIKSLGEGPICKDCKSTPAKSAVKKPAVDRNEYLAKPGGSRDGHRTHSSEAAAGTSHSGLGVGELIDLEVRGIGVFPPGVTSGRSAVLVRDELEVSKVGSEGKLKKGRKKTLKGASRKAKKPGKRPVKRALFDDDVDDDDFVDAPNKELPVDEDGAAESIPWAEELDDADKKAIVKALGFDAAMIDEQRKAIIEFNRRKAKRQEDNSDETDYVDERSPPKIKRRNAEYKWETSGAYLEEMKKKKEKEKKKELERFSATKEGPVEWKKGKKKEAKKSVPVPKPHKVDKSVFSDESMDEEACPKKDKDLKKKPVDKSVFSDESTDEEASPKKAKDWKKKAVVVEFEDDPESDETYDPGSPGSRGGDVEGETETVDESLPPAAFDSQSSQDSQEIL